ncbi:MAG: DUF1579 domain-containing protein [Phycisphaerae bacterium]|nr:DUF1579 domain-containing protein [Phycisphaerae bacterium]
MNIRFTAGGFLLGAFATLVTTQAVSQDAPAMPTPEQMKEMMEIHARVTTPGPGHRALDHFIGDWETTTKVYWGGPSMPPSEASGTATMKWVLDGRFVREESAWTMPMPDPETGELVPTPAQGLGLFGYDNHRNLYVASWADSINTHLLSVRGSADPSGRVFRYYGEMDEPMLGVTGRMVKYETRIVDRNTHVVDIYDLHVGEEYKVIEITYRRR